jgi:hypothetical protein
MHELRVAGRTEWGLVDWDVKAFDVMLQIHVWYFYSRRFCIPRYARIH